MGDEIDKPRKRRGLSWLLLIPLIFLALVAMFLWGMGRENPKELPSTLVGRSAPTIELTPLGDTPLLEDKMLREGGVKLVNFWASWCAPCRAEHKHLMALSASGIPVYGVNYKDEPAKALGFLAELGNPYARLGADRSGRQAIDWGVYGVPETFVLDATGKVLLRFPGPLTREVIASKIMPAIEKAQAAAN
ncbi:MAG: DsbE family thiol:disulfide interchange protein [Alphaproteobacteria bacterium]|nr:MAG: DsbE family thiol:disulfide interchange protein [Alphaproteobacteria bacterium]